MPRPIGPRTDSSSLIETLPSSGYPRSHRPKAMSGHSGSSSVNSQVPSPAGLKSFTTGSKSISSGVPRTGSCLRPLAISRSYWALVSSFIVLSFRCSPLIGRETKGRAASAAGAQTNTGGLGHWRGQALANAARLARLSVHGNEGDHDRHGETRQGPWWLLPAIIPTALCGGAG